MGIGSQWIGVMGVLWCGMPDFSSYPDPANPLKHILYNCVVASDTFHSRDQGIWLASKCLLGPMFWVTDYIPGNSATPNGFTGTLSIQKATLNGHYPTLEGSYVAHFVIRDHASGAELVDIQFAWGTTEVQVTTITYANDALRVEAYFQNQKLTITKKLELTLTDWHAWMPGFTQQLLFDNGFSVSLADIPAFMPLTEPGPAHVETDWDVLS